MRASILDLRRRMKYVLRALERNEPVTILYRGKKKAVMYPASEENRERLPLTAHPAFGMWEGREDMQDVDRYVREIRKGRFSGT